MKFVHYFVFSFLLSFLGQSQDSRLIKLHMAKDISPYLMKGYSFRLGVSFHKKNTYEFSLESFSMTIPTFIIEMNKNNTGESWNERVVNNLALYASRKLGQKRSSFYIGVGAVYLNHEVSRGTEVMVHQFSQLEYMTRLHYKWYLFKNINLYLEPYIALAGRFKVSGCNADYSLTPFLPISSMYFAFEF